MPRFETLLENRDILLNMVSEMQTYLDDIINSKFTPSVKRKLAYSLKEKLNEWLLSIEFSGLLQEAQKAYGIKQVVVNDIDKIIRVGDEFVAIFELKTRKHVDDGAIKVNWAQGRTLKFLRDKLNIPVFYFIKFNGKYYFTVLREWIKELSGRGESRAYFCKIELDEMIEFDPEKDGKRLLLCLADILQGKPELRK